MKKTRILASKISGMSLVPVVVELEQSSEGDKSIIAHNLESIGFNMFSGMLTPESVDLLEDLPFVKRIYLDTPKAIPELPLHVGETVQTMLSRIRSRFKEKVDKYTSTFETRTMVGADVANRKGVLGNVTVGVVDSDSGIAVETHAQLRWRAKTYDAKPGWSGATNGHGTHVSTITGGGSVRVGDAICMGMAPASNLIVVKSLLTPMGVGMDSDIIKGLSVCVNKGARVINMSLGSKPEGPPEEDPICQAIMKLPKNVIVCVASGNDGENRVGSPAYAPNALAINALDPTTGEKADFSNYGPESAFIMPGVNILSGTAPGSLLDVATKGYPSYAILSGTSQATPHATGVIALMVEYFDRLGYTLTVDDIRKMGQYYGEPHTDKRGYGLLKWEYAEKYAKEIGLVH